MKIPTAQRLAVCSWSLQAASPRELIAKTLTTGVTRVQLALDPLREAPQIWGETSQMLADSGLAVVSGMLACIGEDYSTLDSIRLTGGIAPDPTWPANLENFRLEAAIAARLGLKLVTFHAGFIPHGEPHAPNSKMRQRLITVADLFQSYGIALGLETGQETAEELASLLRALNHPNVKVNFDPANMILYNKGDPVQALRALGPWIVQVHIKDATRTKIPGQWGAEVPTGTGEVNWPAFFAGLKEINFRGNLCIEREAGTQRVADIQTARELVEKLCP